MSANISPTPVQRFVDGNGAALSGGLLYTYAAGTSTPQATYTDSTGGTPNANPVVLNARGECNLWLSPSLVYKLILKDSVGVTIWTVDNIAGIVSLAALSGSSGSSLIGFLQAGSGAVVRTLQSKDRDLVSLGDFGPISNGVTSDVTAMGSANGTGYEVLIPPGNYAVGTNFTFTVPVRMLKGAQFDIATGVTLTFSGGFQAPLAQVFVCTGTGKAAFSNCAVGAPEWWGAVTGGADCLAAINACIVACPVTQLQLADYYVSGKILLQTAYRTLKGVRLSWTSGGGTRIISTSATSDILLRGLTSNPGSINSHLQHVYVEDLTLTRSVAVNPASAPAGMVSQYLLFGGVYNVGSHESTSCFVLRGVVQDHYVRPYAFRSIAGTTTVGDKFYGYFFDGNSGIVAAGGNASVYMTDPAASCALNAATLPSGNVGYGFANAPADTFLFRPESASCAQGIVVTGSASMSPAFQKSGDADLHIVGAILDGMGTNGILLQNLAAYAAVMIDDAYIAPASGAGGFVGIYVQNSLGMTRIDGGQVIGYQNVTTGLRVESSTGVVADPILSGCAKPVELVGASMCKITPQINNPAETVSQGAVEVSSTTNRCYIAPVINGGAAVFTVAGVNLAGATNTNNEVNCSAINPTAITGGATNKLKINGAAVTATGLSGTNLVSGVMT